MTYLLVFTAFAYAYAGTPNIVHFMADDVGYNDLGFANGGLTHTPAIDALVGEGVFLKGFHTFKICAPSRASTMTGRYPFNIGYYAMPPDDENQCTSNYTALPQLLQTMGYSTHAYGKWDVGYVAKVCTPTYRGFDTFLGYYKAANEDLWYHGSGRCSTASAVDPTDMSRNTGSSLDGATDINGTYSTRAFADAAIATIAAHNQTNGPLYLYIAPQNVHLAGGPSKSTEGIQAPCDTVGLYPRVANDTFKVQSAVTTELDFIVGNVTQALRTSGLYDNTVIVFTSDNGGPLDHTTNWPLRGGKHSFWEGGVNVVAFVSGPLIPPARRGSTYPGLAHSADWYATFVEGVAGGTIPNNTGPVPHDSVNLWAAIKSGGPSPRTQIIHQVSNSYFTEGVQAMQLGDMKLILGKPGDARILKWPGLAPDDVTFGETGGLVEAGTSHCRVGATVATKVTGPLCVEGCLYNLSHDVSESHNNVALRKHADLVKQMKAILAAASAAAPPVSRYFAEPDRFNAEKARICAASQATGVLEPVD